MQDVIGKLREEAPLLDKYVKSTDVKFHKAWDLFVDFCRAESDKGRGLLADAVCVALNEFAEEYRTLRCSVENVCMMNAGYKEKLGPRAKKPKDAKGQQMLPGLGDVGVTPATTTVGETTTTMGEIMVTVGGDVTGYRTSNTPGGRI